MISQRIMEKQVKQEILDNRYLFSYLGKLGESSIVFEKSVNHGKLIADALVFTTGKGLIGVEIKTEYDSLKRLSHQLDNYLAICNYVTVFIHESWVTKVEKLLASKHINHVVGIIVYSSYKNRVIAGVYKEMKTNPYIKPECTLDMLWKTDVRALVNQAVRSINAKGTIAKLDRYQGQGRTINIASDLKRPSLGSRSLSKAMLVKQLIGLKGPQGAVNALCDMIITRSYDPEKTLKTYRFN